MADNKNKDRIYELTKQRNSTKYDFTEKSAFKGNCSRK